MVKRMKRTESNEKYLVLFVKRQIGGRDRLFGYSMLRCSLWVVFKTKI